jgi:glycosyltransferase involved in cell wall biosynthesis
VPRVSFVVPTRNQAPFLRRCLDACLAQGLPGAEVLVQDGASTDGTPEILASYGDRVAWMSQADGGQAQAVNRAVARAGGEVIAWINSDDCWAAPGCLAGAVAAFEDPEVDLVFGDGLVVDAAGAPIRPYRNRAFASARDLLLSPIGPAQPATLFRRRLFLEAGGLREDLHLTLDYELWLRLLPRARRTVRLPETLAWMTFHPGAKSTAQMGAQIAELGRVKREAAARLGLGPLDRLRLAAGQGTLWAYWLAVRAGLRRAA